MTRATFLFLVFSLLHSTAPGQSGWEWQNPIPQGNSPSFSQAWDDASILTLRIQEGIHLDTLLASHIDSALSAARNEFDTLAGIHAYPSWIPTQLLVKTDGEWSNAWRNGEVLTGEPFIDSLSIEYELLRTDGGDILNWFALFYEPYLNMALLQEVYELHPDVLNAAPNSITCLCEPDDIVYFEKNSSIHLAFKEGNYNEGEAYFRYVMVYPGNPEWNVQLVDERELDYWTPQIYPWNIPDYYPMTCFESADAILDSITLGSSWWVRRHAIEGTWRFFVETYPWFDPGTRRALWDSLRAGLLYRESDVVDSLRQALMDVDADVRESAQNALNQILLLPVETQSGTPLFFSLEQNYPNPFNPSTTIRFSIPGSNEVSLRIFNLLGEEVATLISGNRDAGTHTIQWDAAGQPSGVYFYRLVAGEFMETKKLVLLK